MSIAEVSKLRKEYPAFTLNDVSFSIEQGRITGFIGRNGAGKTTTIKSILNLVHPDGGEIKYFGQSLSDHEADIKKRIGYSTGTISWYPRKKIRDIVSIVREFYETWDDDARRPRLIPDHDRTFVQGGMQTFRGDRPVKRSRKLSKEDQQC